MSNSSDSTTKWRIPSFSQKAFASFNSRSGKEQDFAVTAIHFSPNVSCATFSKNVESTPPKKATATLPSSYK